MKIIHTVFGLFRICLLQLKFTAYKGLEIKHNNRHKEHVTSVQKYLPPAIPAQLSNFHFCQFTLSVHSEYNAHLPTSRVQFLLIIFLIQCQIDHLCIFITFNRHWQRVLGIKFNKSHKIKMLEKLTYNSRQVQKCHMNT
jgi:hypothetical protein